MLTKEEKLKLIKDKMKAMKVRNHFSGIMVDSFEHYEENTENKVFSVKVRQSDE